MYPNTSSSGLSKMFSILYSKFCEATSGFLSMVPHALPFIALISPATPATLESRSNAFHMWYTAWLSGLVPTSSKMTTLGSSTGQKALKSQRWELIFFWFFSLRQKSTCTGVKFFSSPLNFNCSSIRICVVYSNKCAFTALLLTNGRAKLSW